MLDQALDRREAGVAGSEDQRPVALGKHELAQRPPDVERIADAERTVEDKAREAFAKIDQAKAREDFVAAAAFASKISGGNGKLGATGFCYGGGIVNFLATRVPELAAGVPFYGVAAPIADVPKIKAELFIVYAENDERINTMWPAYEAALKAAGVKYTAFNYAGTQHGFNNDTTPRYDEKSAGLAWGRTVALFNRALRA